MIRQVILRIMLFSFCLTLFPADVWARKLPPADFEEMYRVAASGNLGSLMAASSRGLDLNARNRNGDTGLCVAIRRGDFLAYNTFIKAGAHNHPPCVNRISSEQYESFMESPKSIKYSRYPGSFTPRESNDWFVAAGFTAAVAGIIGVILAATGS